MTGVKFINNTNENLKIAVFKQPYKTPSLQVLAWKIIALPKGGGNLTLSFPEQYQTYINYADDPIEKYDSNGGIHTGIITIDHPTARFIVRNEYTNDGQNKVIVLKKVYEDIAADQIQVENRSSIGVWGHIQLGGSDIYPPQIISPGRTLMENVEGSFFVSVIDDFFTVGSIIKVRELRSEPAAIETGDIISITGDKWAGYIINYL
jgi:hypothetical protein